MKDTDADVSRRNFLLRAGQLGAAFTVLGPAFGNKLFATAVHMPPGAIRGADGLATTDTPPAELFSQLRWRMLGPFRGGRVDAVSGVPGRPNEFYFGSVNGGVWKSIDAGRVWKPVFDSQPVASIGALAVAPSAPDTVYVGTGESTLRDSMGYGNGVYKSTDAGATWTHMGLADTRSRSIRGTRTSCSWRRSATSMRRTASVACSARTMAAARGSACCIRTTTWAPSKW